jgi:tRNA G18 (ribose-2'-O)-methylase SpoU
MDAIVNGTGAGGDGEALAFDVPCAREGEIALEGGFLLSRALEAGLSVTRVLCVPGREAEVRALLTRSGSSIEPEAAAASGISREAGYRFHRGVFAIAMRPRRLAVGELLAGIASRRAVLALMPEIVDHENLGAAFRNAAAFGASGVLLGPSGPDPYSRRSLRVSMGAVLSTPHARLAGPEALDELKAAGFTIAACVLDSGARDLRSWSRPDRLALAMGNEAFGLSREWRSRCDEPVTLAMGAGADSLNVATALAVFLYALS